MELKQIIKLIDQHGIELTLRDNRLFLVGNPRDCDAAIIDAIRVNKVALETWLRERRRGDGCSITGRHLETGPLSFAQQRLWLVDRLEQGSSHYNMAYRFDIAGLLNVPALQQAFTDLVTRHAILRTAIFTAATGEDCQKVHPPAEDLLVQIDLRAATPTGLASELVTLTENEATRPFDLEAPSKIRACLIRHGEAAYTLLVTVHHIASDGWSESILFDDLGQFYAARCAGEVLVPPALPVSYLDYAFWQRNHLTADVLQAQTDYWRRQLEGAPGLHALPLDRPRPVEQSFRGSLYYQTLDKPLAEAFGQLCQTSRSTVFMGAVAAFAIWQYRFGGRSDIVFGAPVANREQTEVAGLVGLFVNMLTIRLNVTSEQSFADLLKASRETALDALNHQQLPFDQLVEAIRPARDLSYHPLIQMVLAVQNNEPYTLKLAGTQVEEIDEAATRTLFDLQLNIYDRAEGLQLVWQYSTDLFDRTTITRFAEGFRQILQGIVANPGLPVNQLSILQSPDAAPEAVATDATRAFADGDRCLHELFERQAGLEPERTAVVSATGAKTYGELEDCANRIAHRLLRAGAKVGELVAVVMEKGWEQVAAVLAIHKAGGAYLPVSAGDPPSRINKVLAMGEARIVLTQQSVNACADWPDGVEAWEVDTSAQWQDQPADRLPRRQANTDLAYVIFTSGSTGEPKGVMISHDGAVNTVLDMNERFGVTADDAVLGLSALNFDLSVYDIFGPLAVGGKLVLPAGSDNLNPQNWWHLARDEGVTLWNTVPALAQIFVEYLERKVDLASASRHRLRQVLMSGDWIPLHLPEQILRVLGERTGICSLGGATEASIWSIAYPIQKVLPEWRSIPYGKAMTNQRFYVLDEQFRELPPGVVGELYIGGIGLAKGYWKDPQRTAAAFVRCPHSDKLLYRTGDLGRYFESGDIEFLGRWDSQIKLRGFRVELEEIEHCLCRHPQVEQAAVVLHEQGGEKYLAAYCTTRRSREYAPRKGEDIVRTWETIYEDTYTRAGEATSEDQDFSGWNSSYTSQPIPRAEMVERFGFTFERLTALQPRHVLEIGCGTGLLLYRLLDHCRQYTGFDLSPSVVNRHQARLEREGVSHARVFCATADAFAGSLVAMDGLAPIDTVIINSVIQYFPSFDYLDSVLLTAAARLSDKGRLFIGDIRDYRLQAEFHASVELHHAPDLTQDALRQVVRQRCLSEQELLVAPEYFLDLARRIPGAYRVDILPERGQADHEMHRFRYDVVIHIDQQQSHESWQPEARLWQPELDLPALLADRDGLLIEGYPNLRVWQLCERLDQATTSLPPPALTLEGLFELARQAGFTLEVRLSLQENDARRRFDLWFARKGLALPEGRAPLARREALADQAFSNSILHAYGLDIPDIRAHVARHLPEYMHPQSYIQLEAFPLGRNGKVDRKALPKPEFHDTPPAHLAPSTATEVTVEACWRTVLGLSAPIGIHANFFEIGGHSLLAARLALEVDRTTGVPVTIRQIFSAPTIAGLARFIDEKLAEEAVAQSLLQVAQDDESEKVLF